MLNLRNEKIPNVGHANEDQRNFNRFYASGILLSITCSISIIAIMFARYCHIGHLELTLLRHILHFGKPPIITRNKSGRKHFRPGTLTVDFSI